MDKLREQLIEDIVTYLDEVKVEANIQNTIMQIVVDSFDEIETK